MAASMAFFMTVGKASPCKCCRRRPPVAGRGGGITGHIGAEDVEIEREMGEDVADMPGRPPVGGEGRGVGTGRAVGPRRPGGGRHLAHSAEQALVGRLRSSTAPSPRTATKAAPRRCGLSGFGRPHRQQRSGSPAASAAAAVAQRAEHAGRPARRADRGAEIHHRLGEVAGPALAAPSCSTGLRGSAAWPPAAASRSPPGARSRARHCRRPRRPAGRRRSRRSPRRCRRRCRATPAAPLRRVGKAAAELAGDHAGAVFRLRARE